MITIDNIIRAGAMAQKEFNLPNSFEIRLFPEVKEKRVRVSKLKANPISGTPFQWVRLGDIQEEDVVDLKRYASTYNNETILMGYSEKLNILCLCL